MSTVTEFVHDLGIVAQKKQNELAAKLARGTVSSLEEYKGVCGNISGINWLAGVAKELMRDKKLAEFDDQGGSELPEMEDET